MRKAPIIKSNRMKFCELHLQVCRISFKIFITFSFPLSQFLAVFCYKKIAINFLLILTKIYIIILI
jgi:hypothetical protein